MQAVGEDGAVTFGTSFPTTCPGRWPHFHFEVFGDGWTAQLVSAGGTPETGIDLAINVGVESENVDNNPPPPGLRPVGPGSPSPPPSP
ncbi:hypothetical protein V4U86_04645 [Mycobacterium sp. AMU20-3851]|uniref:hypothetical protein n=1 Tax=Mycobacterium sp. AMU20-3851 TaxID=3122055 RepID=UPI0037549FBC